ncbi:MAG: GumC family protein, partial [Tsuneonella sp.]
MNQANAVQVPPSAEPATRWLNFSQVPKVIQYWNAFRRHRWIVAGILVGALILGLLATLLMTPQFTAATRIEISREDLNVTNVQGLQDQDVGKSLEFYQTQYSLLDSKSLATRVARALNLTNDATFKEAFKLDDSNDDVDANRNGGNATSSSLERATRILQGHVDIAPLRGSSLVDVEFTSPNPDLSAKIANAWAEQFIAASLDRRFESTAEAREFLQDQLTKLRKKLEQSERDLVNYAANKRIIELETTEDPNGGTKTKKT